MPLTLFATTKRPLLNEDVDMLFVEGEVVMVLPLSFFFTYSDTFIL